MLKFSKSNSLKYPAIAAGMIAFFTFQAQAQMVSEILKRIDTRQKKINTLSADLTSGRFDASLKEWTQSKGKLILFRKKGGLKDLLLKVDFIFPRNEYFLTANGRFLFYGPSLRQAFEGEASAKMAEEKFGSFFGFVGMSKMELKKNYSVKYMGTETIDGTPAWHLAFIPNKASKIISGDIWADQRGIVRQIRATPKSGDQTYIRFTNVKENIKLTSNQFVMSLPKDVKVYPIKTRPADVIEKPADAVNKPKKKVKRLHRVPAKPSRLKSRTSKPII